MKILKYLLLILLIWALPTFIQKVYGDALGSFFSYFMFVLLIIYYFISKKRSLSIPFLILGLLYFSISGLINVTDTQVLIIDIIKYFIIIICGAELVRDSTDKDIFIILTLGAITVFINALYFQEVSGGRYGGIFLNPNGAGFICILGYSLGYSIENKYLRILGQFIFIFAGILTLSRTFILLWVIISLAAIIINRKNLITVGVGIGALIVILSISQILKLDAVRFSALENLLENKVDTHTISEDSRNETWSLYTDVILYNIFFGNGYKSMQGMEADTVGIKVGVHNTYLMILGESGIIPFLLLVLILIKLFINSIIKHFKENPHYCFLAFVLIMFLLTSHNFFDNYAMLTISIWLYTRIHDTHDTSDISSINTQ
uniref:O-antigen ligase family protein n=1 Tax=Gelidibacter sp. TaxID=2018083 RepID=UPI00404AEEEE